MPKAGSRLSPTRETDRIARRVDPLSHAASELIAEIVAVMEFGGSQRRISAAPSTPIRLLSEAVKEAAPRGRETRHPHRDSLTHLALLSLSLLSPVILSDAEG
jgi:hypothetical protein